MFGHPNNQNDDGQQAPQSIDGVVAAPSTPPPADFNPALPSPTPSVSVNPTNDDTSSVPAPGDQASPNDLLDIKQQALSQLSPLVGHLEQTPEEKFRTTMMMIQASDNQALIKDAYAAAQAITDEKAKAQALLDIVNEINYFTQHQN